MTTFLDKNFGRAMEILEQIDYDISGLSVTQKIETIKIVIQSLNTTFKEFESLKRYKENSTKEIRSNFMRGNLKVTLEK